jgi:uncharacterized protein
VGRKQGSAQPKKAQSCLRRSQFNDPFLITFPDEYYSGSEDRLISIGTSTASRILLVVHIEQWEQDDLTVVRIISARKATASERKVYEEN